MSARRNHFFLVVVIQVKVYCEVQENVNELVYLSPVIGNLVY